jgi:hypothetical protein
MALIMFSYACALIETNEENPLPVEEDLFEQSLERPVMK